MSKNSNLHTAKAAKNDEFYTQLTDIEKELKYYKDQFKDKVVYCNCDNPNKSEFVRFFRLKFVDWGLKKLIATCITEDNSCGWGYVWDKDINGNGILDEDEVTMVPLKQNGDFASPECIEFLKEADIVVTNPPFSLFRDFIKLLMDYNKKFLVIGNMNAITYKEIFPYIKDGKLRTGKTFNKTTWFEVPAGYKYEKEENGMHYGKVPAITWFTNLETHKADNPIQIIERYKGNESKYPHYDNYDAINCDKIADFPIDLPIGAVVGVPITIVCKIADDGYIYFDDCGMNEGLQKYGIEKFRKGDDDTDLRYTSIGGQTLLISESLSSVSDREYEYNDGCKLLYRDKRKGKICQNVYQAYKVIGQLANQTITNTNFGYPFINGHKKYARIIIQKIK